MSLCGVAAASVPDGRAAKGILMSESQVRIKKCLFSQHFALEKAESWHYICRIKHSPYLHPSGQFYA